MTGTFAVTHTWTLGSKPPSPSETAAALSLRSEPSGATVYINDVRVGRTPLVEYELGARGKDEEPVTVRLEHDGYNSEELVLNAPPQVQTAARIYWHSGDEIRRANLDGTNVEVLVTGVEYQAGFAFDVVESQMYWTEFGKIKRANLDGTDVQVFVTERGVVGTEQSVVGLDLTKDKMYWATTALGGIDRAKIKRVNLNGSDVQVLINGNGLHQRVVYDVALDVVGRKMYWVRWSTIFGEHGIIRASLDGSNVEVLVTGVNNPLCIALDTIERKMYWTEMNQWGIKRANLDGSNAEVFFEETMLLQDIALDVTGRKIYWIKSSGKKPGEPGTICRADLKDSNRFEILIMGVKEPHSIALYFPSR